MDYKELADKSDNIDNSNDVDISERPLNSKKISSGRVDINVLRSKL